jgi:hypothetical protein
MRNTILLSSLSVGRCFTLVTEPGGSVEESKTADSATRTQSVLKPEDAWKITDDGDAEFTAQSAKGESKAFDPASKVVEIPRQGFDRLVEQA